MLWKKYQINNIDVIEVQTKKYQISFLEIGGAIYKFKIQNPSGEFENIILTYEDISEYQNYGLYLGANIGRYAGRISDGFLELQGKKYYLEKNDNETNFLHGGSNGMHRKKMKYNVFKKNSKIEVVFKTKIYQTEDNLPGNIDVQIKYICKNDNITIEYSGVSDQNTIFNPTNHTYFNLNGDDDITISNHFIKGDIKKVWLTNDKSIPYKKSKYTSLIKGKYFKDILKEDFSFIKENNGYDNPFEISGSLLIRNKKFSKGIQISSSHKTVVIYTQGYSSKQKVLNKTSLINNGIAIEFQNSPNKIKSNEILFNMIKNAKYKSFIAWDIL